MSKGKKGTKDNPIVIDSDKLAKLAEVFGPKRPYEITMAVIKDDFCNYSYEIVDGVGVGDSHAVKGSGLIENDMRNAFSVFNVHLPVIDDVFKHSDVQFEDVDKMHGEELTGLYHVTGFKIKGSKDNESIVLVGNKYVSQAGGRLELETPKIPLDNLSSYAWFKQLKIAADKARLEVALYKEGKYTAVEIIEETDLKQTSISFDAGEGKEDDMKDFEGAQV